MSELALFAKTTDFAAKKHREQRRKDIQASPYINHPIGVANLASSLGGVTDIVVLQVRIHNGLSHLRQPIFLFIGYNLPVPFFVDQKQRNRTLISIFNFRLLYYMIQSRTPRLHMKNLSMNSEK